MCFIGSFQGQDYDYSGWYGDNDQGELVVGFMYTCDLER